MNSTTTLSNEQRDAFNVLLGVARDLTSSLATSDRYTRLLDAVRRVIPCDAACLLRVDGPYLTPVAGFGLSSSALSRRYDRREQPRLDVILRSAEPVRFPADSPLAERGAQLFARVDAFLEGAVVPDDRTLLLLARA